MEVCNYQTGQVIANGTPSSQTLELGTGGREKQLLWSTEDGRALDLEIRARIVSLRPAPTTNTGTPSFACPLVVMRWELSHGAGVLSTPESRGGLPAADRMVPLRGMLERVTARNLAIFARFAGWVDDVPNGAVTTHIGLKVSVQIVQGMHKPGLPVTDMISDTRTSWIPPAASHVRVSGQFGVAPAGASIDLVGLSGAVFSTTIAQFNAAGGVPISYRIAGLRMPAGSAANMVTYYP